MWSKYSALTLYHRPRNQFLHATINSSLIKEYLGQTLREQPEGAGRRSNPSIPLQKFQSTLPTHILEYRQDLSWQL